MNCRKVQYYLSTYSEGSLSSDKLSEMEVHIRNCKSCEREKFILEEILVAARSLPAKTTPDDFNLKLFNRIYAEQNNPSESYLPTPESSWIRRPVGWVSALATVAAVALITVVFLQRPARFSRQAAQRSGLFTDRIYVADSRHPREGTWAAEFR